MDIHQLKKLLHSTISGGNITQYIHRWKLVNNKYDKLFSKKESDDVIELLQNEKSAIISRIQTICMIRQFAFHLIFDFMLLSMPHKCNAKIL